MQSKTFKIYVDAIGSPGSPIYKAREDLGEIQAASAMRALDEIAAKIGTTRIARTHSIPVLGLGSVKVEEVR